MKQINVISVYFSASGGVQPLYETIEELVKKFPKMSQYEISNHTNRILDGGCIGFVKCTRDFNRCVIDPGKPYYAIEVYSDEEFEIL